MIIIGSIKTKTWAKDNTPGQLRRQLKNLMIKAEKHI